MARLLKWVFGIIGGVIVLSIIAAVIIISRYDFNDLKPVISKTVYDATGRELVIGSDIDLKIGLSPSLVLSDIKFQNADWGSRKEMAKIGRFEIKVALIPLIKKNIQVNRFILKEPDILIETDKNGKTNLEFKTAEKVPAPEIKPDDQVKEPVTLPALTVREFEIIDGTLTYRDGKTGKSEVISLKKLRTEIHGLDAPLYIDLNGAYNNEPFQVSGTLGSINGINDSEMPWPVDIAVKAFGVNSGIKGSIKNPVEQKGIAIDFNINIDDWKRLSKLAGQEIPIKDALSITGNIADSAPKAYRISGLKISLGKNQIEGSVSANLSGKVPFINASFSSKELDLTTLMKDGKETEKPAEASVKGDEKMKRLFSDEPVNLDSLKAVNGKFKISIDKLVLSEMVLNTLSVDSTMSNGSLALKPLKMSMGGGNIGINMDLASKSNGLDLSSVINVKGLELAGVLEKAGIKDKIEGLIDADIDIKGRGSSIAAIMGGLNGYSTVAVSEGVISNKYIGMLGSDFSKGIMRLLNPAAQSKDYTTIKCMVTRFDIREGIADATVLAVDTNMMSVAGSGDINLKNETINLSLDPSAKGGVAGYNLNIGELAQPFKLGGTLAKPSLVLDKQKAAVSIGKVIGKDGLKGLLKKDSSETGTAADVDICATALQAARTGVKPVLKKEASSEAATSEEAPPVSTEKLIQDAVKDPKKALKDLFGR